jgi:hypothetical protein
MPDGWAKKFGHLFCEDLREVLERNNFLDEYVVLQVKEKYGQLRWYDNAPEEWYNHMDAWEYISEHTCVKCGKFPVPMRDDGWISPWCDECFRELHPNAPEEQLKKWTYNEPLVEYLFVRKDEYIDMKPYYEKLGYNGPMLSKETYEKYTYYKESLKKWIKENGPIKDPAIIPYEIQQLNPLKEKENE